MFALKCILENHLYIQCTVHVCSSLKMMYENNIYLSADLLHTGQEINLLPWIYTIIEVEEQQLQLMVNQGNIYSIVQNIYCTVLECTVFWNILIQQLTRQIDLLKMETHVHRDNFLNILGSFFLPAY